MNSDCFYANIDAFGEKGYIVLAEKAFICCRKKKMFSVSACNVMIKAYGLVEKLDEACEIADDMDKYGILPDYVTYSSLIQLLSTAKQPKKAIYYLEKMKAVKLLSDCVPYSVVMYYLVSQPFGEVRCLPIVGVTLTIQASDLEVPIA